MGAETLDDNRSAKGPLEVRRVEKDAPPHRRRRDRPRSSVRISDVVRISDGRMATSMLEHA
jgi:hypothetical protein